MTNYAAKTTNYDKATRKGWLFVIIDNRISLYFGKGDIPLSLGIHPKETSLIGMDVAVFLPGGKNDAAI